MRRVLLAIAVALALVWPALGADLEREARELETMLIAPCCFSQQVSVHPSPAADDVRKDLRARLRAGQSRDEIVHAYVEKYGRRILAQPPAEGAGLWLHTLPMVGLVASVLVIMLVVRSLTPRRAAGQSPPHDARAAADTRYSAVLDEQLRDLD